MNGNVNADAVRTLAYELWQRRGDGSGSPEDDWFQAEQMLSGLEYGDSRQLQQATSNGPSSDKEAASAVLDHAVEESFPASDPPAVHHKDEPPVNAEAKWQAAKAAKQERQPAASAVGSGSSGGRPGSSPSSVSAGTGRLKK